MKSSLKLALLTVFLLWLAACARSNTGGIESSGDLLVNGPGTDSGIHAGIKRFYTLKNINQGQHYTLHAEIGLLPDETTPDGTLSVVVYSSESAFKNNEQHPEPNITVAPLPEPNQNVYEAYFAADSPSGDYVVVIDGSSSTDPNVQFFYNLRIMSADPPALTKFITPTVPAVDSQQLTPLNPGYLNIYDGGKITSSGTYTIGLVSNATATSGYPQLFVYKDNTLGVDSLLYSCVTDSMNFIFADFTTSPTNTRLLDPMLNNIISGVIITGVTFTSELSSSTTSTTGPFIMLKGVISAVTYTLTVGP